MESVRFFHFRMGNLNDVVFCFFTGDGARLGPSLADGSPGRVPRERRLERR